MVASVDHLASSAGTAMLRAGGTAADAAIAANAVVTVTAPNMCGMGGDLFALVHEAGQAVACLNASGRAGSGADPDSLRDQGHTTMPFSRDIRSATVPGCVDGWQALHDRYGRLPFAEVLAPAIDLARNGFAASPILAETVERLTGTPYADEFAAGAALRSGEQIRRPDVAAVMQAVADGGRAGFYLGEFGRRLLDFGRGEYHARDLAHIHADWVEPLTARVWGHEIATVPPNSQGYLTLAGALIAAQLGLPADSEDSAFAHLLVEAARQAAFDRPGVLHEHADGAALIAPERLDPRAAAIDPQRAATLPDEYRSGGTMYLCAVDDQRMGVSLIQSLSSTFGSHLVVPGTGVHLHNRGAAFSLEPGHRAEYGPGRRPPHTLSPALVTRPDGSLRAVLGTMGGDAQPQVVLQLLARLLVAHESAGRCITAGRWTLQPPESNGFDTWTNATPPVLVLESHCPDAWSDELSARGHRVITADAGHGHAHLIEVHGDQLRGAADPRAVVGAAIGY
jgi:gamma-glutamyltranspeptidase/glutathione hydrolase